VPDRPNILLITTDQERWDVSNDDNLPVSTPNTERLQDRGMTFERAYTPSAICSPARASLLTGLYPHNHGILSNPTRPGSVQVDLREELPTFSERLAADGYRNSYIGNWHIGEDQTPADFGFEPIIGRWHENRLVDREAFKHHQQEHLGLSKAELPASPTERNRTLEELEDPVTNNTNDIIIAGKTPLPKEATETHFVAEQTIEQLEQHADSGDPFFHRTDIVGPHAPYIVPEPYASMYDPEDIDPWPSFAETFDGKPRIHEIHPSYYDMEDSGWETWRRAVAKYFGYVSFIDEQVGRILDAVDSLGLAEDTVVVRTADHGDFTGGHRQFDKGPMMYEDIYHIPLVVRWPGTVAPGSRCTEFVSLLDLMPTFLEIAGIDPPGGIDGRSLRPLLGGNQPDDWRDAIFAEYHGEPETLYTQRMIRTERYKYVFNGPDRNELYDFANDPHELNNLVDNPEYAAVKSELEERLGAWMEKTGDHLSIDRYRRRTSD